MTPGYSSAHRYMLLCSVMYVGQTGQAQVADLNERGNGHPMIIQSNGFALTSLAISSNMQFIALGDEIGTTIFFGQSPFQVTFIFIPTVPHL